MARAREQEVDVGRLCAAIQRARLVLRHPRNERREMVRQYVGRHWSEEGSAEKVPANLIAAYCQIVGRSLIAKNPRVMLGTFDRENKPAVSAMETWANREIGAMHLAGTLQRVVLDALFSVGVCKVALSTPLDAAQAGWNLPAGRPFAERVDLDDFVFDVHARDFTEVGFIGHRFRVPLEVVQGSKLYSKAARDLSPSPDRLYNAEGDERVSVLGRTTLAGDGEEFEDFVDLWEVYVPRKRLVLTLADDHLAGPGGSPGRGARVEALRVQEWLGPDEGPYHVLGYSVVPGNIMPKAQVQDLIDLHEAVNHILRKLIRQAERQKEVVGVRAGSVEDGSRVIQASDGDLIRCDNPENLKPVTWGGPNAQNFQLFVALKDLFSWLAGNLDIMGGLSPQSKTASQDKMLNENSSRSIADMQDATVTFTSGVVKALCWYWWHDPFRVMQTTHKLPGLPDMAVTRRVTPAQRQKARFEDLEVSVDPYSLQHSTPQSRAAGLNQVVQQVVIPMAALLQQQGVQFDVNAYLAKIARYLDMPDLSEVVTLAEPPAPQGGSPGGGSGQPAMPAQTTRTYERRSVGGSPAAREQTAMQEMASAMGSQAPQGGGG